MAFAFGLVLVGAALADQPAAAWAASLPPAARSLAELLTAFGSAGYMLAGSALAAAVAWRLGRTARAHLRARAAGLFDAALLVFLAIATSGLCVQLLKHVVGRVRPRAADPAHPFSFHPFSLRNAFASFPSGHATSAFAAAAALGLILARGRLVLFALAGAIGASRVMVGEHYPSDVVGGAALGTMISLTLARSPATTTLIASVRALADRLFGPGERTASGLPWAPLAPLGSRWSMLPALAAGSFALAIPPGDLFGSESAEHAKDGCAILIALAGLTMRTLLAGLQQEAQGPSFTAPRLATTGMNGLCRHPRATANLLVFLGLVLMHGNPWTVVLGSTTYVGLQVALVRAEEARLLATHGAVYEAYRRRVPRWLPEGRRLVQLLRGAPFDLRRALGAEYPFIGMTVIGLALAEFYEEIEEPLVGGQLLYVELLGALILAAAGAIGTVWLARRARPA